VGRSKPENLTASISSPLYARLCSLIPGIGVKLSAIILAGPTVLSAVGACPPHDGVRRRWWINVASAVSLIESSQKIGRSHHRHRPGRDVFFPPCCGNRVGEGWSQVHNKFAVTTNTYVTSSLPPVSQATHR
jgi:hypothetical protein